MFKSNFLPTPASVVDDVSYTQAEFISARRALIDNLLAAQLLNEGDLTAGFSSTNVSRLAELSLLLERALASKREKESCLAVEQQNLDQLKSDENENSELLFIVKGPKIPLKLHLILAAFSILPGLAVGNALAQWIDIAILADIVGIIGSLGFLFAGEQFILIRGFKRIIINSCTHSEQSQYKRRKVREVFVSFVVLDALLTILFTLMSLWLSDFSIDFSALLLVFLSIGFAILTALTLYEHVFEYEEAVKKKLAEINNDLNKAFKWYRHLGPEKRRLERAIKPLKKQINDLTKFCAELDNEFRRTNQVLFRVDYIERPEEELGRDRRPLPLAYRQQRPTPKSRNDLVRPVASEASLIRDLQEPAALSEPLFSNEVSAVHLNGTRPVDDMHAGSDDDASIR